jgi:hypothetical protein
MNRNLMTAIGITIALGMGFAYGNAWERKNGQAVQERAAAIDACAREANVYPESCQMKAVVVTPREEPEATSALLPPPVGMKG